MNRIDSLLSFRRTKYAKCTFDYEIKVKQFKRPDGILQGRMFSPFHKVHNTNILRCKYCHKLFDRSVFRKHLRTCTERLVYNMLLRNFVLEVDKTTDVIDAYCCNRRFAFQKQYGFYNDKSDGLNSIAFNKCDNFINTYGITAFRAVERIRNSLVKRKQRVKERITHMLATYDEVVFLTLTFKTPVLKSTTEEERRACVVSFLKSIHWSYVANIDYGKKNGREHYHCVVASRLSAHAIMFWRSKFGRIGFEQINNHTTDASKIGQYIAKLTNHAIKKTTKRQAIIYSRKK